MIITKTSEEWLDGDIVLSVGDTGYESDTGYRKIGDGVSSYYDLPYELFFAPRMATPDEWAAKDPVIGKNEQVYDTLGRYKFGDGVTPYSGLPYGVPDLMNNHSLNIKMKCWPDLIIEHDGLPSNAYIVIRRRRRCSGGGKVNRQPNMRKWAFVGTATESTDLNRISALQCLYLPVNRAPGLYHVDISAYLPFVKREYDEDKLISVSLSGNKWTGGMVSRGHRNCLYQDLDFRIVYLSNPRATKYYERYKLGQGIQAKYTATYNKKSNTVCESIVVK